MQNIIAAMRRGWRNPVVLLLLASALIAFAVQSGDVGSADTAHRLQSAHAFWTSEPPVFPEEYPEFGIHGRGGKLQSWYGIGQSLLLFPFDVAGTWIEKLPLFDDYNGNDPSVRSIVVSYGASILVNVLTALVCLLLLRRLGFSLSHAIAGVLALLLLTTHLHYTQNMMENNYICLLTLAGFCWQLEWAQTGSRRALWIGSAALGLNLLTRLTTGMDLLAAALFIGLVLWLEGLRGRQLWIKARTYAAVATPVYCFFGLLDRVYQFYRFGSFFNTYVDIFAKEARQRNPALPPNYPFETPFHIGFNGALFTPEKSIFLFDPLLVLMILVAIVGWKRFSPVVRAYLISSALLLLAYICFYARYTVWSGDDAWGDRYVSTAVELAALLAVPLLLRFRRELGRALWRIGLAIMAASAVIQLSSLAFWLPLELYQMEVFGHPTFVIWLRLKNIAAFALHKMNAWGLATPTLHEDPWDYVHMTCWNILPAQLRHAGIAPNWAVVTTWIVWWASVAALAWVLWRLWRLIAHPLAAQRPAGQDQAAAV